MSEVYSGRCLCGVVKFEARGKPKGIFWCHCDSCRRHTGAPVSVFAGFANDAVAVTQGDVQVFAWDDPRLLRSLWLDADLRHGSPCHRDPLSHRSL